MTFLSNQITQIQETIALTPKICYTLPTNKKSHQRMQALGSSQKVTNLKQPNVLRCIRPYSLGFFIDYLNKSMSCTITFRIKIKISIFLNFFIVPPPPVKEEMSLTTR